MEKKVWLIISLILFIVSAFIIVNSINNFTGYAIFEAGKPITSVLGIFILLVAIIVYGLAMMAAPSTVLREKKRGGLEKVFFRDEGHVVRLHDFRGELTREGIPDRTKANDALRAMHEYERDQEEKEAFRDILGPYIKAARAQRDIYRGEAIAPNSEADYADRFLREWDPDYQPLIHRNIVPVPLDYPGSDFVRVRHYTTISRAKRIATDKKFGGDTSPRPLDQGKVFIELSSEPILSPQEFRKRYAMTGKNIGEVYIEFLVPRNKVYSQINPRNKGKENYLLAEENEGGKRVYKVLSNVEVHER